MTGPTDISGLFGPTPPGPSQPIRYRQGIIATFNPVTLANTVLVSENAVLTNVPMLGVAEAASLAPGSVVGMLVIGETNGATSWAIIGRIVAPNTPEASDAITRLAQQVHSNTVPDDEAAPVLNAWTNLATQGPAVTVTVGASGQVLIIASADVFLDDQTTVVQDGWIGLTAFGANTIDPNTSDLDAAVLHITKPLNSGHDIQLRAPAVMQWALTGLDSGETTFGLMYVANGAATIFGSRAITVITL